MVHNCIHHMTRSWWTTTFLSPMWSVDDIFVLSDVVTSLCPNTVSTRTRVGHLLLSAKLPETHWVMIWVIWCLALTVSDICLLKTRLFSVFTYSALQVSYFMRCYTNSRLSTNLELTHFVLVCNWNTPNWKWLMRYCRAGTKARNFSLLIFPGSLCWTNLSRQLVWSFYVGIKGLLVVGKGKLRGKN